MSGAERPVVRNRAEAGRLFARWAKERGTGRDGCPTCAGIGVSTQDAVPAWTARLIHRLDSNAASIYSCPECGQMFEWTSWMSAPDWGECMAGITEPYEVQALYRWRFAFARDWVAREIGEGGVRFVLVNA